MVRVSAASPRLRQPNQNSFIKTQRRYIPKAFYKHISHKCNLTRIARLSQQSLTTCICTYKCHNHTNISLQSTDTDVKIIPFIAAAHLRRGEGLPSVVSVRASWAFELMHVWWTSCTRKKQPFFLWLVSFAKIRAKPTSALISQLTLQHRLSSTSVACLLSEDAADFLTKQMFECFSRVWAHTHTSDVIYIWPLTRTGGTFQQFWQAVAQKRKYTSTARCV